MNFFIKNKIELLYSLFICLVVLLVYERFLCHNHGINWGGLATFYKSMYNHPVYNSLCIDNIFNNQNLWKEGNFVENLQAFLLFFSILLIFFIAKKIKNKNITIYYFLILQCGGLIFFLGEEISWGQHIFHWESPEIFLKNNKQEETNLHNISNLLNEYPRSLVLLWCSFSSIAIIIASKFYKIDKLKYLVVCPNNKIIYVSLLLILFVLPDLIVDKFDMNPGHLKDPKLALFYDQISFNFLRLSELHELIFSFYFFVYSLMLKEKIF